MSLATRCTACDTAFRVVQDQLRVSEGWVRCGRCQAVFNALEGLIDLEPAPEPALSSAPIQTPPPLPEPARADAPAAPPVYTAAYAAADTATDTPAEARHEVPQEAPTEAHVEATATADALQAPADFDETPASRVAARDRIDFADAQFNRALLAEAGIDVSGVPSEQPAEADAAAASADDEPAPEFLRQAERQARRARPRTVVALWLLCIVLLLGLGAQAAIHFRDLLAGVAPPLRPALEAACDVLGCRIEPLRRIEDIVIESSTLSSLPEGDAVRLSVVLRNRGALALAMPSVELTLTDAGGQMLARRVLAPSDFGVKEPVLSAASEHALQLVLSTGSRRASGYTVEPFYP